MIFLVISVLGGKLIGVDLNIVKDWFKSPEVKAEEVKIDKVDEILKKVIKDMEKNKLKLDK